MSKKLGFESIESKQALARTGVPGPTGSSFRFGMFHLFSADKNRHKTCADVATFDAAHAEEN